LNGIPAFNEFITAYPGSNLSEDIQYRIGEAYFQKAKYFESLKEFLKFILAYTKSPRTPNAQYYVAVCQESLGNTLEAALQDEAFVKNYPQHELAPEMMFRLASNEFLLERYAQAADHFVACAETYVLKEYQPRAWYNAAVAYEKLQLPSQAAIYYGKLLTAYPQDANTKISLARLALLQAELKNYGSSEAALKQLAGSRDRDLLQKTLLGLAALYQEQGDDAQRQAVLQALVEQGVPQSDDYSLALIELASIDEQQKAWAKAIQVYQRLEKSTTQAKWRAAAQKRIKLLQRILGSH
jgi:tetratricopeptide (TPR) repeat protein